MKPSGKPRRKSGIPVSLVEDWGITFVNPKDLLSSPQCPPRDLPGTQSGKGLIFLDAANHVCQGQLVRCTPAGDLIIYSLGSILRICKKRKKKKPGTVVLVYTIIPILVK